VKITVTKYVAVVEHTKMTFSKPHFLGDVTRDISGQKHDILQYQLLPPAR